MSADSRPLSLERLRARLDPGSRWQVEVLPEIDSTNEELRRRAAAGAEAGTVLIAERQTAGRGRLGRSWHSPPGGGLYASVLFRPARPAAELARWTVAGAVAACRACRRAGAAAVLDWPNDVTWQGRKLAGVLAELRTSGDTVRELVLGTGINVTSGPHGFPAELSRRAAALDEATGGPVEREALAASWLGELEPLAASLERGEWDSVARAFEALAPGVRGAEVRVVGAPAGAALDGRTEGLAPDGALWVRAVSGELRAVRLADAVRPRGG